MSEQVRCFLCARKMQQTRTRQEARGKGGFFRQQSVTKSGRRTAGSDEPRVLLWPFCAGLGGVTAEGQGDRNRVIAQTQVFYRLVPHTPNAELRFSE